LRVERLKRFWTNNFFYRDWASSRFHTAKTDSGLKAHRAQSGMPRPVPRKMMWTDANLGTWPSATSTTPIPWPNLLSSWNLA